MDSWLSDMSPEEFEFSLISCILVAIISLHSLVRNWRRMRLIEDTPTAKLRSAHQGYVKLVGKGEFINDQVIYAPLSNHPCLWYHSQIQQKESVADSESKETRWRTVYHAISDQRFKLIDGDSSCYIDPTHAEINGNEHLTWFGNTEWPTKTLLLESQSALHELANNYRYSESLILPGQSLYILGQFTTLSAAMLQSERSIMIDVLNQWKKDQVDLQQRFDSNRDGKIDQQEWEVARQQARTEAEQIHKQLVLEPEVNIISKPEKNGYPFIISVYHQTFLAKNYRHYVALSLIGLVISIGSFVWLLHHF